MKSFSSLLTLVIGIVLCSHSLGQVRPAPSPGPDTATPGSPIRIFGEMVALLTEIGCHDAAVKLESLWNELRDGCDFSLFCAYPLTGFAKAGAAAGMHEICGQHTKTIPAESYSCLTSPEERLRAIAFLQQHAQQLAAEIKELEERLASKGLMA